jgi:DNA-binding winged helix-turn-helix (wHTH) protein/tetratricopeptide (TPR) repeat protein
MTEIRVQSGRRAAMWIGVLEVRPSTLEVVWAGGRERLQPRVTEVLVVLGAAEGEVVTRDELIAQCWGGRAISDDSINLVIAKLRKLSARTGGLFRIETIAKVGYRLSVGAAETCRAGGEPAPASVPEAPTRERRPWFADVHLRLVGAAFIAALVSAAAWALITGARATASPPEVVVERFVVAGPGLPETFADDLREDMLTTFQPGAAGATLRSGDVGAARGAYRLRGRIEPVGGQVEVYARLESPDGSRMLWSSHYETPLSGARPAAIGHEVMYGVSCLMGTAAGPHAPGLASPATATWADYCVENARTFGADLERELAALRKTAALDPQFFAADAFLGALLSQGAKRIPLPARRTLTEEGLASAQRAQRLEPGRGEGYMAEAMLREDADPGRAEALYLEALRLRPSRMLWEAQSYSHLLERLGRVDAASGLTRRVLAVQPNSLIDVSHMAWADAVRGRYDSAQQTLDRLQRLQMNPQCSLGLRLKVAVWARNWEEARTVAQAPSGCALTPGRMVLVDALSSGDPARLSYARAQFEALVADPATLSPFTIDALALVGDDRAALAALGRLIERDGPGALYLVYEPSFAQARRTPEFEALATRFGLVSYWRNSGQVPDFCQAPDPPGLCLRLLRPLMARDGH